MKASQYIETDAEHMCLYGEPGTGKSTLAMELLTHGYRLQYFSIDAGVPKTIFNSGNPRNFTEDELSRLEVFILRDTAKFPVGIQTCRKVAGGGAYNLCDAHGQIDCSQCRKSGLSFSRVCLAENSLDTIVIFDHLTNLSNSALNTVWDGESRVDSGSVKDDGSTYTTWRQVGWLLNDFLSKIQIGTYNSIVIAQEMLSVPDDKSKKIAPHAGTKEFSSTSASYFGHVVHCSISNGEHRFGSASTYKSGVLTKSRNNIKIEDMKVPSLAPFFKPVKDVVVKEKIVVPEMSKQSAPATTGKMSIHDLKLKMSGGK